MPPYICAYITTNSSTYNMLKAYRFTDHVSIFEKDRGEVVLRGCSSYRSDCRAHAENTVNAWWVGIMLVVMGAGYHGCWLPWLLVTMAAGCHGCLECFYVPSSVWLALRFDSCTTDIRAHQ